MNALVTGATGFVGGHLVDRLLERGEAVTALVRSRERAAPLASRGVRLVIGNLANHDALREAVAGQDVVYHSAALLGARSEADIMAANRDGTLHLAHACEIAATRPRVVFISSMAAGGPSARGDPKPAAGDDHPVTMYGKSKLAAERMLASTQVSWVALRPPVVYGPRDREGFLPLFKLVAMGVAPVFGDGSMEVSLIYIADLVDAIVLAGTTPGLAGGIFYVNHPETVTGEGIMRGIAHTMGRSPLTLHIPRWAALATLEITGAIASLLDRKSILHPDKIHEFYQAAWTSDPAAFMAATGWQPAWNLERGLAETAKWYRDADWT